MTASKKALQLSCTTQCTGNHCVLAFVAAPLTYVTSAERQYLIAAIAGAAWSREPWRFWQRTPRGTENHLVQALRLERNGPPRQARLGADGPALFEGYPR